MARLVVYEVTIVCPRPKLPEGTSDRLWNGHLERLGFVIGGNWEVLAKTIRATLRVEGDGCKVLDGFTYRDKDSSWAIEQALRCWRTEMRLLLSQEESSWHKPLRIEVRALNVNEPPVDGDPRARA